MYMCVYIYIYIYKATTINKKQHIRLEARGPRRLPAVGTGDVLIMIITAATTFIDITTITITTISII